jgi:formate hydrogenlyase subunit 6/NADH:ubiquinone oxidoreductase subunit I
MNDVYQNLARHLDNLPAGFPSTETGVEIRILKRLFTPQEAEIAVGLVMMPEPVSAIAARLKMAEAELAPILDDMSRKGLIYRSGKGGKIFYMAAQFVVGIWEYHVKSLDLDLIKDFNEYSPYLMKQAWSETKTKQLRVIPISKSISAEMLTMPYDEAEQIIKKQSKIVVCPCICRTEHKMAGKGCDRPVEVCLTFGSGAYYYEENGLGRSISQTEALDILAKGMEAGLVLQPGNSQKPTNICLCCGCCCQILKNLNNLDEPAKAVHTNYFAEVTAEDCTACWICQERCQMQAIEIDDVARVKKERCIGCGLCVTSCSFDAMHLIEKAPEDRWTPPANTVETYVNMAKERGKI